MNSIYLSPAFSKRSDEDLRLLQNLDGRSGFCLFWLDIVCPLLLQIQGKCLLEIGADEGENTRLFSTYCDTFNATLTVIDPVLKPSLQQIVSSSKKTKMIVGKSHDVLPTLDQPLDAVFLEGDLNYYTTYSDLAAIKDLANHQNITFPTVFVRSASWPYARRDMYYDPQSIPVEHRHDYEVKGMTPWSSELEDMKFNWPYANAKKEGGPANGVLTAVEDFIKDSELSLKLFSLPLNHGLSILYLEDSTTQNFIRTNLLLPPLLAKFLETFELARLNGIDKRLQKKIEQRREYEAYMKTFRGRTKTFLKKIIRL